MGQITLRGIDLQTEKKIRAISKSTGKSLNKVIQEIIYQQIGSDQKGKSPASHSLRKFAGGWSEKDASDFYEAIKLLDQIDETMWK